MYRIILIGAGPLGLNVARFLMERPNLELAGVVDLNPDLQGKEIGECVGGSGGGVRVTASLEEAMAAAGGDVDAAVITTVSSIRKIFPTIASVAEHQLDIVTTCEELSYPWFQHPEDAARIDRVCKTRGVSCLGTGVNPGYLMDYLPAVLTSLNQRVDRIEVERIQNAAVRRVPFQKKIGAGLSLEEFAEAKERGTLRHVGLPESLDLLAAAMGWDLDERSETLEPVLAAADCSDGFQPIRKGQPAGVEQIATGILDGREVIRLRFRAAVGEPESCERITVSGLPGVNIVIPDGINGDVATSAITVNAIRSAIRAAPGLQTMLDVPVPAWSAGMAATPAVS